MSVGTLDLGWWAGQRHSGTSARCCRGRGWGCCPRTRLGVHGLWLVPCVSDGGPRLLGCCQGNFEVGLVLGGGLGSSAAAVGSHVRRGGWRRLAAGREAPPAAVLAWQLSAAAGGELAAMGRGGERGWRARCRQELVHSIPKQCGTLLVREGRPCASKRLLLRLKRCQIGGLEASRKRLSLCQSSHRRPVHALRAASPVARALHPYPIDLHLCEAWPLCLPSVTVLTPVTATSADKMASLVACQGA